MNKIAYCLIVLLCMHSKCFSQVGIGNTSPDPSSILHIQPSTNDKGILVPRLSTSQINMIVNPAYGLLVFNTDLSEFQFNCTAVGTPDWTPISHNMSVKYHNLDTSSNINTAASTNIPIFGDMDWNDDTSIYSFSGNVLTINTAGRYRITVNISYTVPTVGNNSDQRVSVEAQLAVDGTLTGSIANTGYVRHGNGHREASLHLTEVLNISPGQTISVQTIRGGNSAPATFRSVGTSNIYVEKIK